MKNKRAAMEMTVGTIVTIVLLMSALVLGLILTRSIFKGSQENIDTMDQKVKDQINKMFSEDELKPVVIYPSQYVQLKKGKSAGFGLSIRNNDAPSETFSYVITARDTDKDCNMQTNVANGLISLGAKGTNIKIISGNTMSSPVFVRFDIPETTPTCVIRYELIVTSGGTQYDQRFIDVEILPK